MLQVSLGFSGNAREALAFYVEVFGIPMPKIMTYGDMPTDPSYTPDEKYKDWVLYTDITIMGVTVMLSDYTPDMGFAYGKNVGLVAVSNDVEEIKKLYASILKGGTVEMELQKTFWSELYGMGTDKFGISWQFNLNNE